jgi:hypothetical protein
MVAHHCMAHPCPLCFPHLAYTFPPAPVFTPQGCICPPTSEKTCENALCPRKTFRAAADSDELLARQEARDNMRLIDHIADQIGLPKDQELSQENFDAWAKASTEVK